MALFEALYGRKCRTPLYWNHTGESQVFGPEILQEAEKQVQIIRENLKTAQSWQKAMLTIEEESCSLKLELSYILKFHQWEEWKDFRLRVNYLLATLARSKFWKEKVK
jgi:hypothetical protein